MSHQADEEPTNPGVQSHPTIPSPTDDDNPMADAPPWARHLLQRLLELHEVIADDRRRIAAIEAHGCARRRGAAE